MRLIDTDKLLEKTECLFKDLNSTEVYMGIGYNHGVGDSIAIIKNAPTIEAEPVKHGRWREYNYPGQECVYCSACKTEYYPDDLIVIGVNDYPYYCPNCGAKMDLEGEEA